MSKKREMKIKITPTDDNAVLNGKEFIYRGVTLIVARSNNSRFLKIFKRLSEEKRSSGMASSVDNNFIEEISMKAMSEAILVGWKPFNVGSETVEYSHENALNLLTNDSDAREAVSKFANNLDNFLIKQSEDLLGE